MKINNHSIAGTLIYNDDKLPDTDAKIKFYAKGFFGQKYYLGESKTNIQGQFKFEYHWQQSRFYAHKIVAEVVESRRPFAWHGPLGNQDVCVEKMQFNFPAKDLHHDIGTYELKFADAPSVVYIATKPYPGHMQGWHYYLRVRKAYLGELLKTVIVKICRVFINVLHVQKIYDSFGPKYIKKEATEENLISELFNEICVAEHEESETDVTWQINWDGLELDIPKSVPNIKVVAEKNGSDPLKLKYIEIKFREDAEPRLIKPTDDQLKWAIFIARSTFSLRGEIHTHLAEGHLLPALVAQSFFKYIKPNHPLYKIVAPHLSQIQFVNWVGAYNIIYGEQSLLEMSGLSAKAIADMLIQQFKDKGDYTKDIPRETNIPENNRGRVSRLHYELLFNYFRDFVEKNREQLVAQAQEIYQWSKSMNRRLNEITLIVQNPNEFTKEDEERLIQCLAWVVHKTTFIHWVTHSNQQLLTDIRMVSFGIRDFGLDKEGKLAPGGNMEIYKAAFQLRVFRTILNFDADKLLKNRYGDIDQKLIELIKENSEKFKPYDVNEIHPTAMI